MKSKIIILFIMFCLFGCSSTELKTKNEVGYNKISKTYDIEENANIKVAVKSYEYGEALVSIFNELYPEKSGVVSYEVVEEYTARNYLVNDDFDLIYISEEELPLLLKSTLEIDQQLVETLEEYYPNRKSSIINMDKYYFVPMEYSGFYFAYNATLLESLGIDMTDSDNDNLVDAIDSFEKIFELMDDETICENLFCFYPLNFYDRYSFYPFLTAGNWQLFSSNQANRPGFDSEQFKTSLEFINELSKHQFYCNTTLNSSELPYVFDEVLLNNNTLMTQINSLMYYPEAEELGYDYVFCHMPTYQGNILTPLTEVIGYGINANTQYPGLCMEVLRIIRSREGLQAYLDNTDTVPYLSYKSFDIDDINRQQMILAASYSVSEPLIALKNNTTIRAFDMYYEIDWISVIKSLFDQEITVDKAQEDIVELANNWLLANNEELYVEIKNEE